MTDEPVLLEGNAAICRCCRHARCLPRFGGVRSNAVKNYGNGCHTRPLRIDAGKAAGGPALLGEVSPRGAAWLVQASRKMRLVSLDEARGSW